MSNNANQQVKLTPVQAHQILTQVAAHKSLALNLEEHSAVQAALAVLKPVAELTTAPQADTF